MYANQQILYTKNKPRRATMALFETKKVIDANGKETVERAGPLSKVNMASQGNTTCITKEDVFGVHKKETCVTTPNTVVNNGTK